MSCWAYARGKWKAQQPERLCFFGFPGRGERDDRAPDRQLVRYQLAGGEPVASRLHALPAVGELLQFGRGSYRVTAVFPGSVTRRTGTVVEVEVCPVDR